jgi:hypothetical protein
MKYANIQICKYANMKYRKGRDKRIKEKEQRAKSKEQRRR